MKQFNLEEYLKNPSRKVVTREGLPVKIHCINFVTLDKQVIAEIDGCPFSQSFSKEGRVHSNTDDTYEDLFFAPEKHEGWVNVYRNSHIGGYIFDSDEDAIQIGGEAAIATVKIEWEE